VAVPTIICKSTHTAQCSALNRFIIHSMWKCLLIKRLWTITPTKECRQLRRELPVKSHNLSFFIQSYTMHTFYDRWDLLSPLTMYLLRCRPHPMLSKRLFMRGCVVQYDVKILYVVVAGEKKLTKPKRYYYYTTQISWTKVNSKSILLVTII